MRTAFKLTFFSTTPFAESSRVMSSVSSVKHSYRPFAPGKYLSRLYSLESGLCLFRRGWGRVGVTSGLDISGSVFLTGSSFRTAVSLFALMTRGSLFSSLLPRRYWVLRRMPCRSLCLWRRRIYPKPTPETWRLSTSVRRMRLSFPVC